MARSGGSGRTDPSDDEFPEGDGQLDDQADVACPYCGEWSTVHLDPDGGPSQRYVEDCPVCCQPWDVRVRYASDGSAGVEARREDGT